MFDDTVLDEYYTIISAVRALCESHNGWWFVPCSDQFTIITPSNKFHFSMKHTVNKEEPNV